jgi:RNA polymerase sigma-70 factor (ECF subfamily)
VVWVVLLVGGGEAQGFAITSEPLEALWRAHAPGLAGFIARRTLDAGVAADLTAETFAQAFTKRHQFRGGSRDDAVGWLYGIARHQASHFVRRHRAEARALQRLGLEPPRAADDTLGRFEELAGSRELRRSIATQLRDLSPQQQEALRLRVLDELSYEQMAARLGIDERAVRARVSRGIRTLAARLAPELHELA